MRLRAIFAEVTDQPSMGEGTIPGYLRKLRANVGRLALRYFMGRADRDFIAGFSRFKSRETAGLPVILVQCPEDPVYLCLFSWIVGDLKSRQRVVVDQFVPRSLRAGAWRSPLAAAKAFLLQNALTDRSWIRRYAAFCDRVGYRSASLGSFTGEVADLLSAWKIWRRASAPQDVLGVRMEGIPVGDLIYDSFLRFRPAPSMQARSPYLLLVIWQAARDVRRAIGYFRRVRPKIYLTSYSTYVQHGIAARVALSEGVRVFSFGNYQEFAKELRPDDWVHTRNPDGYRKNFLDLADPGRALVLAEQGLGARINGQIDSATAYMKQSAYASSSEVVPDVAGATVVFLHDFFDSPHCYRWMLFPDFWIWITATFEIARRSGLRLCVKPHPNQITQSESVVDELRRRYPEVQFLSPQITNLQLAHGGMKKGVTVYGTVAHELAFLGIPTVSAGDHPHVQFDFCQTARSTEEYAALLAEADVSSGLSAGSMREQSLQFYFMHNLDCPASMIELRKWLSDLRSLVAKCGDRVPPAKALESVHARVSSNETFKDACAQWAGLLRSQA